MKTRIEERARKGGEIIPNGYSMRYSDLLVLHEDDWITRTDKAYRAGFYMGIQFHKNQQRKKQQKKKPGERRQP